MKRSVLQEHVTNGSRYLWSWRNFFLFLVQILEVFLALKAQI